MGRIDRAGRGGTQAGADIARVRAVALNLPLAARLLHLIPALHEHPHYVVSAAATTTPPRQSPPRQRCPPPAAPPAPIAPSPAVAVPAAAVAAALDHPIGGTALLPRHVAAPVHHARERPRRARRRSVQAGGGVRRYDGRRRPGPCAHGPVHPPAAPSRALLGMRIRRRLRWPPLLLLRRLPGDCALLLRNQRNGRY